MLLSIGVYTHWPRCPCLPATCRSLGNVLRASARAHLRPGHLMVSRCPPDALVVHLNANSRVMCPHWRIVARTLLADKRHGHLTRAHPISDLLASPFPFLSSTATVFFRAIFPASLCITVQRPHPPRLSLGLPWLASLVGLAIYLTWPG